MGTGVAGTVLTPTGDRCYVPQSSLHVPVGSPTTGVVMIFTYRAERRYCCCYFGDLDLLDFVLNTVLYVGLFL